MPSKLYIIGNGFDLHHNLKTSYYDFADFLENHHPSLFSTIEEYILNGSNSETLWSNFEENLANLDVDSILNNHIDDLPNYASDSFRESDRYVFPDKMQELCENLTIELRDKFEEFIRAVIYHKSTNEKKIKLDPEALFLNFNYTNTLERVYSIEPKSIVYIHNSAFVGADIVLGHGREPESLKNHPVPPDDIEVEDYEEWFRENEDQDFSYSEGKQNLLNYFNDSYKPTKEIIQNNASFFNSLKAIEEIFVLGHSISNVDLPYFKEIVEKTEDSVIWKVSYHNVRDYKNHIEKLVDLGIKKSNIKLFKIESLQESGNQLEMEL